MVIVGFFWYCTSVWVKAWKVCQHASVWVYDSLWGGNNMTSMMASSSRITFVNSLVRGCRVKPRCGHAKMSSPVCRLVHNSWLPKWLHTAPRVKQPVKTVERCPVLSNHYMYWGKCWVIYLFSQDYISSHHENSFLRNSWKYKCIEICSNYYTWPLQIL